jgi:hypothetical protein
MKDKKTTKARKKRLKTLNDVRKFLSLLINEVRREEVDAATGTKLAYMLNILRAVISEGDLENRIRKLEEVAKNEFKKSY